MHLVIQMNLTQIAVRELNTLRAMCILAVRAPHGSSIAFGISKLIPAFVGRRAKMSVNLKHHTE